MTYTTWWAVCQNCGFEGPDKGYQDDECPTCEQPTLMFFSESSPHLD